MIKNSNELFKILVENYNFEGFMHETRICNLCQILKDGILKSRDKAGAFEDSADKKVLKHTDKEIFHNARFYFFKKTPTNYWFDKKEPNNMVYIVFNWDIILLNGTKVANGNAASDYTKIKLAKDYLSNPSDFMDWEKITHRSSLPLFPFPSAEYYEILRKRNAEIIVPNGVSTKYIDKIIFKSEKALSKFKNELNNDKIYSNYKDKIKIDSSYFKWE